MSAFFVGYRAPGGGGHVVRIANNGYHALDPRQGTEPGWRPSFDWGRRNHLAGQCAAALLWACLNDLEMANLLWPAFFKEIVSGLPEIGFTLTEAQILHWVQEQAFELTELGELVDQADEQEGSNADS